MERVLAQNAGVSERPKRVLLFVTDLEVGGTPTVVRELAKRLPWEELEISVACLGRFGPVAELIERDGGRVEAFDASAIQLPHVMRQLRGLVREQQVDVVLSFLVHANTVAALAWRKLPGVRWLQSIQTTQPYPWWHWKLQRWAATKAEKLIVPSQGIVETAGRLAGIGPERFVVIPNAVDEASIVTSLRPVRDPQSILRIGFVGRLDPVKNVPSLVHAVRELERVELHIFGQGPDRQRIERAIDGDPKVTLHGTVERERAFSMIDVLCLPSSAEGFGLVLIEAMAAGVPVIASDIPGIRNVVEHDVTGLLFDKSSLAAAIERVRHRPHEAHERAVRAIAAVRERFTWQRVVPRFREIL